MPKPLPPRRGTAALVRLLLGADATEVAPLLHPENIGPAPRWRVVHGHRRPAPGTARIPATETPDARPHAAARTPAATTPLVAAQAVDPVHLATLGTALGTSYLAVDGGTLRALVPVTEGAADRTAALARLGWTLGFSSPVPASARVGIAHPLHLGETLKAWSEMFADYEILQPFPQLGRPVYALTENERASGELTRFEGVTVPVGALLGRRGWDRGVPQDNGTEHWISRPVEGGCVVINLDPGIQVGYVDLNPEQRLQRVWLGRCPDYDWSGRDTSRRFGELDPVTASEILADLTQVTRLAP